MLSGNEERTAIILEEVNDALKDLCRNMDRIANALDKIARSGEEPSDDQPPLPPPMRWGT